MAHADDATKAWVSATPTVNADSNVSRWNLKYKYTLAVSGSGNGNVRDGKHKKDLIDIGFLAQEVKTIETDLGIDNHAIVDTSNSDSFGMKYNKLIPVLVNAIQELSAKNDALLARIETLEG